MAVISIVLSKNKQNFSKLVDGVLRLSYRWPVSEAYVDGFRTQLSELPDVEGRVCLVVHHSGSNVVELRDGELVATLGPSRLLGDSRLDDSPFVSKIHVCADRVRIEQGPVGSPPIYYGFSGDCIITSVLPRLAGREFAKAELALPKSEVVLCHEIVEVKSREARTSTTTSVWHQIDVAAQLLLDALRDSIKRSLSKKCAVLFSGGLDSSLLLWICIIEGLAPVAISVGTKASHDLEASRKAAEALKADYLQVELSEEAVADSAAYLEKNLELSSVMDKALAVLVYEGARCAVENNRRQVATGQGADELFGGYMKYLRLVQQGNYSQVEAEMRHDADRLWLTSIPRDYGSATLAGCLLTTPLLDERIIDNAYNLPLEFKISRGVRKVVLRTAAKIAGLPRELVKREKKAAQYGTGIERALRKLGS